MSDYAEGSQTVNADDRARGIVRTSVVGIVANVLLAGFKAAVGILSSSIAIVLDAVNNLSDAASSLITIVGTKLAGKEPDRAHPYGYGRIEYLTTIVIAAIVLWAGITSLSESVQRIFEPDIPSYNAVSLVIVAVAVVAKLVLGRYVKGKGVELGSDSLVASGTDATMDAVISASTLVAALVFVFSGVSLEAWLGAIISLVIIKAGVDILREALGKILGERVDAGLSREIKARVAGIDGVRGAYDLVLNDYGPDRLIGSIHVEVDEALTAPQIDALSRKVTSVVNDEFGVMLHTVGVYSTNTADAETARMREQVVAIATAHPQVVGVHGFYVDKTAKTASFDVVVGFGDSDRMATYAAVVSEVEGAFPQYSWHVGFDADMSD